MTFAVAPMNPARPEFAAQVSGVDIAQGVTSAVAARIEEAIDRYAVLVFRGQVITDEQQYAFSQHFGEMESATGDIAQAEERRLPMTINDISNLDQHGRVLARDDRRRLFSLGNMLWHSDSSFKEVPAKFSLLSARIVPERDGNTEFADMRAAWDALDPELQAQCRDLICEHSQLHSRGKLGFDQFSEEERIKWAPVRQRLVRRHPRSGRNSLFLSAHAGTIIGWPMPEARLLLMDLTEHATQRAFVYAHVWRQWDLVMWDNRVTMHRARRVDASQVRDMRRTTVACESATISERAA